MDLALPISLARDEAHYRLHMNLHQHLIYSLIALVLLVEVYFGVCYLYKGLAACVDDNVGTRLTFVAMYGIGDAAASGD